jgi:membrane-bound ClpP family serine protease
MDYLTIAVLLFAMGAILLAAEVLLPTGGFLVVAALVFFAVGVAVILAQGTTVEAVAALSGLAIGLPIAGIIAVSAWKRLSLSSTLSEDEDDSAHRPGSGKADALKNHTGKTVSPMRPSGTVEFDGQRIDAMTEGGMLEAGVWVRCVDVRGGKVIVRQMESPPDITDIDPQEARPDDDLGFGRDKPSTHPASAPPEPKRLSDNLDDFDLDLGK